MRLISYRDANGDHLGVQHDDGRTWSSGALGAGLPHTMADLLAGGPAVLETLRSAVREAAALGRPSDVTAPMLLAPLPRPGKIVAVGLNYHAHAAEGGAKVPDAPMLFAKFPTSVVGPGATVEWDPALTDAVDMEAELAVVIGRTARRVSEADALDHVLGFTCLNDVSARDLQHADRQFVRAKSLDTFCPMGPALVTADEIPTRVSWRCAATATASSCRMATRRTSSSACRTWWRSAHAPSPLSPATSSPRARRQAWASTATPRCSCTRATS